MLNSNSIRKNILQKRLGLSKRQQQQANSTIIRKLQSSLAYENSTHIAFYMPINNEVDILPLLNYALECNKVCYLPVLHPLRKNALWFVPFKLNDEFVINRFGIPEPIRAKHNKRRSPRSLDLVLTPLIAFDENCNRIGMGSGFYDRTFSFKKNHHTKPQLIGLAYDMQKVKNTFPQAWDIPLDVVVTEKEVYKR